LVIEEKLIFLDPFTLRVNAKYGIMGGEFNLDYQYAHDWPGYVVKIKHQGGSGGPIDS